MMRERKRQLLEEMLPGRGGAYANVLSHIDALNVGANLFLDRSNIDILAMVVEGENRFITGDQPVITSLGTRKTWPMTIWCCFTPFRRRFVVSSRPNLGA